MHLNSGIHVSNHTGGEFLSVAMDDSSLNYYANSKTQRALQICGKTRVIIDFLKLIKDDDF